MANQTKTLRTLSSVKQFSQHCIAPHEDSLLGHIGRSELINAENFFGLAQQSSTDICALQRTSWRACRYASADELRISAHHGQGDKQ